MREAIANQGEIRIDRIAELPAVDTAPFEDRNEKGFIISHSEQGHHHILGDAEIGGVELQIDHSVTRIARGHIALDDGAVRGIRTG